MSVMSMSVASDWGWIMAVSRERQNQYSFMRDRFVQSSWRMSGTGGWISKNVQDTRSCIVRMILIVSAAVAGTGKQLRDPVLYP